MSAPHPYRRLEMPAVVGVLAKMAKRGQRFQRLSFSLELMLLVIAALSGLFTSRVGAIKVVSETADLAIVLGAFALLCALTLHIQRLIFQTSFAQESARVVQEALISLSWRYAVGGMPFPLYIDKADLMDKVMRRVEQILHYMEYGRLPPPAPSNVFITESMQALRLSPLAERRAAYCSQRLADQEAWYQLSKRAYIRASTGWNWFFLTIEMSGATLAVSQAVGLVQINLLNLVVVLTVAGYAWTQARQYPSYIRTYATAARKLSVLREIAGSDTNLATEDDWASFVQASEATFARDSEEIIALSTEAASRALSDSIAGGSSPLVEALDLALKVAQTGVTEGEQRSNVPGVTEDSGKPQDNTGAKKSSDESQALLERLDGTNIEIARQIEQVRVWLNERPYLLRLLDAGMGKEIVSMEKRSARATFVQNLLFTVVGSILGLALPGALSAVVHVFGH